MEKIILLKEADAARRKAERLIRARNKACALIEDAKARYIKDKTRARSKKAALERDSLLSSPKFAPLKDYEKFDDIQEAYGYDCITEAERDRLEDLWKEREKIKNNIHDGFYNDEVTEALHQAYIAIVDIWEDQIEKAEQIEKDFKKQRMEAETSAREWTDKQNEEYEKIMGGKT